MSISSRHARFRWRGAALATGAVIGLFAQFVARGDDGRGHQYKSVLTSFTALLPASGRSCGNAVGVGIDPACAIYSDIMEFPDLPERLCRSVGVSRGDEIATPRYPLIVPPAVSGVLAWIRGIAKNLGQVEGGDFR